MDKKEEKEIDNFLLEFNRKFLANQKPLGEKFEVVLFNNLWDLYEDADKKELLI